MITAWHDKTDFVMHIMIMNKSLVRAHILQFSSVEEKAGKEYGLMTECIKCI